LLFRYGHETLSAGSAVSTIAQDTAERTTEVSV
jgi:hypothetical protein